MGRFDYRSHQLHDVSDLIFLIQEMDDEIARAQEEVESLEKSNEMLNELAQEQEKIIDGLEIDLEIMEDKVNELERGY